MPFRDQHSATSVESLWWRLNKQSHRVRGGSLWPLACIITASRTLNKTWHPYFIKVLDDNDPTDIFLRIWFVFVHLSPCSTFRLRHQGLYIFRIFLNFLCSWQTDLQYRLLVSDKGNLGLQCSDQTWVKVTEAFQAFTVFFHWICFSICRSTYSISQCYCNIISLYMSCPLLHSCSVRSVCICFLRNIDIVNFIAKIFMLWAWVFTMVISCIKPS